eukprot:11730114-Alexandrium_andersonii.AAC.1
MGRCCAGIEEEEKVPVFVVVGRASGAICATQIPEKGADVYSREFVMAALGTSGRQRVLMQTDQEQSIMELAELVKQKCDHEMVCLAAPLASHASDGRAEAAVKSVRGTVRTMK